MTPADPNVVEECIGSFNSGWFPIQHGSLDLCKVGDDADFGSIPNGVHVASDVLFEFIRRLPTSIIPLEECYAIHS